MITSTAVPVMSYQDLVKLAQERLQHIEEIKDEVAKNTDNIDNPEPLFSQLGAK